jgi:DNA uptake protein ComE-like DNA-binding protein
MICLKCIETKSNTHANDEPEDDLLVSHVHQEGDEKSISVAGRENNKEICSSYNKNDTGDITENKRPPPKKKININTSTKKDLIGSGLFSEPEAELLVKTRASSRLNFYEHIGTLLSLPRERLIALRKNPRVTLRIPAIPVADKAVTAMKTRLTSFNISHSNKNNVSFNNTTRIYTVNYNQYGDNE